MQLRSFLRALPARDCAAFRKVDSNKLSTRADKCVEQEDERLRTKMRAWHVHSYGPAEDVSLSERYRIPFVSDPKDVLVRVHASSVNPIDVAMLGGYGSTVLNAMRGVASCSPDSNFSCSGGGIEFPLSAGRDFCGRVIRSGQGVAQASRGAVWGVVPVHRQGCHAEYVCVPEDCLCPKPANLTDIEAASIPYACLTAWNALYSGCSAPLLGDGGPRGKKVLVLGAAGGVGSLAVQMLLAENVKVTAVCSTDAADKMSELGDFPLLDYTCPDYPRDVVRQGPYDVILDCAGIGTRGADFYPWEYKSYVTLSSPLLRNTDQSGLLCGMLENARGFLEPNIRSLREGRGTIRWAFFSPSREGLDYITGLARKGQLRPRVDEVFGFDEVPLAYRRVSVGHMRGKAVVNMMTDTADTDA